MLTRSFQLGLKVWETKMWGRILNFKIQLYLSSAKITHLLCSFLCLFNMKDLHWGQSSETFENSAVKSCNVPFYPENGMFSHEYCYGSKRQPTRSYSCLQPRLLSTGTTQTIEQCGTIRECPESQISNKKLLTLFKSSLVNFWIQNHQWWFTTKGTKEFELSPWAYVT